MMNSVPDPLATILRRYCNVNDLTADWLEVMQGGIDISGNPGLFRRQLADAILNDRISPAQFEQLTLEDFDTQEDLRHRLISLWQKLFGSAPVSVDPPQEQKDDE